MKILKYIFFAFSLCLTGCLPVEDEIVIVSFWTDSLLDTEVENVLYINDEAVGEIKRSYERALCNMSGLVNAKVMDEMGMHIEIKSSDGKVEDIGMINLSGPSKGLSVKPNAENEIFVEHDIDDPCILVRLRW